MFRRRPYILRQLLVLRSLSPLITGDFEHSFGHGASHPAHAIPEVGRRFYARAYAQPGAMRAGFEVFRAFEQDAKDFAELAQKALPQQSK